MSKLTRMIGTVVGNRKSGNGHGQKWFWLLDTSGQYKRGPIELSKTITECNKSFEHWKMTRIMGHVELIDHFFIVKDKQGNFVGVFHTPEFTDKDRIVMVHYSDRFADEEEYHDYNRSYQYVTYYEKQ